MGSHRVQSLSLRRKGTFGILERVLTAVIFVDVASVFQQRLNRGRGHLVAGIRLIAGLRGREKLGTLGAVVLL